MTEVPAPRFHPEMLQALLEGRKRCTTRREKIGQPGDRFVLKPGKDLLGITFLIKDIRSLPFGTIASKYYICEGFKTEQAFRTFWVRIHRGQLPADDQARWLHVLERV